MKRALIISGGRIQKEFALRFLRETPYEICIGADRGIVFCRENHVKLTHIVGDFDSAGEEALAYYQNFPEITVQRFRPEKDFTDTELAVKLAIAEGADSIAILGGTGSRLDHVAANIRVLELARRAGVKACLADASNRVWLTDRPLVLEKKNQFGKYVSLFAFGGAVENVTLEGFAYPLTNYHMETADPIGVSNEMREEICRISFTGGILMVIESKD